jgi:hypothetical protein
VLVTLVLSGLCGLPSSGAIASGTRDLQGTNYFGDGLDAPSYIAGDGSNLWFANGNPATVTELSESTGALKAIAPIPYDLVVRR